MKFLDIIRSSLNKKEGVKTITPKADVEEQFSIPSAETLTALSSSEPLSHTQIMEVVHYIKNNYHLITNKNYSLESWMVEFSRCVDDADLLKEKKEIALYNLVASLRAGERFDPTDALWLSDKIYVDEVEKRIITKTQQDGHISWEVLSSRNDNKVEDEVVALRMAMIKAKQKSNLNVLTK